MNKSVDNQNSNKQAVQVWKKYALTVTEATNYFNIGDKKIRRIIDDHIDDGFVIQNGAKLLINRKKFEEFLDETTTIYLFLI